MDTLKREQVTEQLVSRMTRAILGEPREVVSKRYVPVLETMSDKTLQSISNRAARLSDIQLYLLDEKLHNVIAKHSDTAAVGRHAVLMFELAPVTTA